MKNKIISPAAINALKEALTHIYWYKPELKSFLTHTISEPNLLEKLDWTDYKRNIASRLVDFLARNQDRYQADLLKLLAEVARMEDFSHLKRLDDGNEKVKKALDSVNALRKLCKGHFDLIVEEQKKEERRQAAHKETLAKQGVRDKLEKIKQEYFDLIVSKNPQTRGFKLEKIMKDIFNLFDLDPKSSFKIEGEQIDGAFTFDKTDYLFEAKWQENQVAIKELDAFSSKIGRKLDNTLGLFLSINGYSEEAVKAHSNSSPLRIILMDGSDLMAILEGRIDMLHLLFRKRRHASQTGKIYLRIEEIFQS